MRSAGRSDDGTHHGKLDDLAIFRRLDRQRMGRILAQRLVGPRVVIVVAVISQQPLRRRSLSTITRSRHSRRILPIGRSAIGFRHGDIGASSQQTGQPAPLLRELGLIEGWASTYTFRHCHGLVLRSVVESPAMGKGRCVKQNRFCLMQIRFTTSRLETTGNLETI